MSIPQTVYGFDVPLPSKPELKTESIDSPIGVSIIAFVIGAMFGYHLFRSQNSNRQN